MRQDTSGAIVLGYSMLCFYRTMLSFLRHSFLDIFIVLFQDVMCSHFVFCSRLCTLRTTTDATDALRSRQCHTHTHDPTKEFKFVNICCHHPLLPQAENRGTHLITTKRAALISVQRPAASTSITPAY